MRTHNASELFEKVKQRVPDAEERLEALRLQDEIELQAFEQVETAFKSRMRAELPADLPHVAPALSLIGDVLKGIDADFTIRVRFADGRSLLVLPEDLAAITSISDQLPELTESNWPETRQRIRTSGNGLATKT